MDGVIGFTDYECPRFCFQCGSPFPWQEAKIAAAKELADELDLPDEARETLRGSIDDLTADTPRTALAITRYRKVVKGARAVAKTLKPIMIEIVTDAVKKTLFPD